MDAGVGLALTFSGVKENIPAHAVEFRPLAPDLGHVEVRLAWKESDTSPALRSLLKVADALYSGVGGAGANHPFTASSAVEDATGGVIGQ